MTPDRPSTPDSDLVDRFAQTVVELQRKLEQLEAGFEPFADPERGADAFRRAWGSDDPGVRNGAEVTHATFERVHQLTFDLIDLGCKFADRRGALPQAERDQSKPERLAAAGVLSMVDATVLAENAATRNEGQHAYVRQAPGDVWLAARRQIERAPAIAARLTTWFDSISAAGP